MKILHGDSAVLLRDMSDNSVDSVVTDPPYALNFMGKKWDTGDVAFSPDFWREVLRVLKPGGHVAAFGASRGYHRMACAIEDAGFEIRDSLMWVYGTGFPKSHDVSKGIDKSRASLKFDDIRDYLREIIRSSGLTQRDIKAHLGYPHDSGVVSHWVANSQPTVPGWVDWQEMKQLLPLDDRFDDLIATAEREKIGEKTSGIANKDEGLRHTIGASSSVVVDITAPATDAARQWEGWGTALKPAFEPIVLARKPLSEGTVAANVLRWGTGALNIDGCRIHTAGSEAKAYTVKRLKPGATLAREGGNWRPDDEDAAEYQGSTKDGRWPANVVHDGSDEVVGAFPTDGKKASGVVKVSAGGANRRESGSLHAGSGMNVAGKVNVGVRDHGDSGSAARFFYSAKASRADRAGSKHPTVKPIALMEWLATLITPPGGTILDPFAGSGTTGAAAARKGFSVVLCEREAEYVEDIKRRFGVRAPSMEDMLA